MKEEIENTYEKATNLRKVYREKWCGNTSFLSFYDKFRLCKYISNIEIQMEEKTIKLHDKRVNFLIKRTYGSAQLGNSSDTVTNLSSYELTEDELFTLKLGLNFSIPPTHVSREQIAAQMEVLYGQACNKLQPTSETALKALKAKLHDITYSYAGSTVDRHDLPLMKNHITAVRSLRENDKIFITRPDKGSGVVIVDRIAYFDRIETEILSDTTKFTKIGKTDIIAATKKCENHIRKEIKKMYEEKLIGIELRDTIRPTGTQVPRLYGLPKVHKPTIPFRPILSMVNAPQERLAKWLLQMIKPAETFYSKYCIKDSFTFAKDIQAFHHENLDKLFMVSYDVSSLFTNVPVVEAITITTDYLFQDQSINSLPVSKDTFIELMKLATVGVNFTFGGNLYKQIDGVAMGSPLGPALANIFLGFHESRLFTKMKHPLYYKRYVDDTFVVLEHQDNAEELFIALNSLHPSLKFTKEEESDKKLPFLDVLVSREYTEMVTTVYRKSTFTGEYMKWNSFAPKKRKVSLIHTLTWRALSICSPCRLNDEMKQIKSILLQNGYPERVIETQMAYKLDKFKQELQHGAKLCPLYIKLPWIGDKSIAFENQIKKSVRACFYAAEVRTSYCTKPLMRFQVKEPLPTLLRNKIIYEFKCLCDQRYVGRTKRRLLDRVVEHVPSSIRNPERKRKKNTAPPNVDKQKSSIAKHLCKNKACAKAYKNEWFSVLDTARSSFLLQTLEATYIASRDPILCRQKQFVYTLKVFK